MVKRAVRVHLIGRPANELGAGRVHRRDKYDGEILGLVLVQRDGAVLGHESGMGERGTGGQHLRARHHDAVIPLFHHMHEDVLHLVHRPIAIHRRIDQHMIQEQTLRRIFPIPGRGAAVERSIELRVRRHARHERGFVVRSSAHKTVTQPGPDVDGFAGFQKLLRAVTRFEEFVRALSECVGSGERLPLFRIVERVIEASHGPAGVAECRMRSDIGNAFPVNVNRAGIAEGFEIRWSVQQPFRRFAHRFFAASPASTIQVEVALAIKRLFSSVILQLARPTVRPRDTT